MGRSISRMLAILRVVIGAGAFAQTAPAGAPRPASLGLLGGFSGGAADTGGSVGGVLAFDITDRESVEGRGIYMQRGSGSTGLDATGIRFVPVRGITRFGMMTPGMTFSGDLSTDSWTGVTFDGSWTAIFCPATLA